MYDTRIPDGGPNPTIIEFDKVAGAEEVGEFQSLDRKATVKHDEIFGMDIGIFTGSVVFAQRLRVTDKERFSIEGNVRAQACDNQTCTPPLPVDFSFGTADLPASLTVAADIFAREATPSTSDIPATLRAADSEQLWSPVIEELNAFGTDDHADASLWSIFLRGLFVGICSADHSLRLADDTYHGQFLPEQEQEKPQESGKDAAIYGSSIIIIYVTLGLIITAIFGAAALNNIATSPVFNLIFFALLITFAFSFMGLSRSCFPRHGRIRWTARWTIPPESSASSSWRLPWRCLLPCTGPIIGWLLVDAATQGNFLAPALGMSGFALALSIPFTLFAIFPSWLKTLPKSGSWLNAVKVVLGFIVLAVSLKFLSVADLSAGWGILNRDIFLALWIVIFGLLGAYLLGKIKLHGDSELSHVPLLRLFLAILSFAFTIYLVPGLWGAPLKPVSSIVPPLSTQDFKLAHTPMSEVFNDYETGMAYAAQTGKPILLEFGGHGCVNCHKMDANRVGR
jgi:thiol:disulfide interchange protein DsbD